MTEGFNSAIGRIPTGVRPFFATRLFHAIAASLAIHLGLLALPAGRLSFDNLEVAAAGPLPLRADFHHPPPEAERQSPAPSPPRQASSPERDAGKQSATPTADSASSDFGVPLPRYYEPGEVTERATPARKIDLESPVLLGIPGKGKLILLLWINENGSVDRVDIESSDLADTMRSAIIEQFRRAEFMPARLNGRAVKSRKKIEVVVRPPMVYVVPPTPAMPASAVEN